MKALIIDDELNGIITLEHEVTAHCPEVEIIGKYQSSIEGLKAAKRLQPDLLFLDIEMPHLNGLEVLELAGADKFNAIFTTAYDNYKIQALRLNALDYLMKPVDKDELKNAVARVRTYGKQRLLNEQIQNALSFLQTLEVGAQTRIGIKSGHQTIFVNLLDICHCNSDGNFTNVYLTDNTKIYSSYPLGTLKEILPDTHFYRCHREYIVNGKHIWAYDKANGGQVIMTNKDKIPLSRANRAEFFDFLRGFLGEIDI